MSNSYNKLNDQNEGNPFEPSEMFGKNYQQALTDPKLQQQHQEHVGAQNPATKLDFQDFNLGNNSAPAYTIPEQPSVQQTQSQPLMQEEPLFTETPYGVPPQLTPPPPPEIFKPWNVEYYRFLFNVNTKQVAQRIARSLTPYPPTFLDAIQPNPDMYGPFWIASTVVFLLAATGNIATYLNTVVNDPTANWTYNLNKLSYAAAAIYGYFFLMPLVLWLIFRYNKVQVQFIDMLCLYGYSIFVYMPISVLCIIPSTILRWALVGVAGLLSTTFIVTNTYTKLKGQMGKGFIILIVMALFHLGFALTAQLYFFTYS